MTVLTQELEDILEEFQSELDLILEEGDHLGLIANGAPRNEYSIEADLILRRLPGTDSENSAAEMVHQVFVEKFDEKIAGSLDGYRKSSARIWGRWTRLSDEVKEAVAQHRQDWGT